MGQGVMIALVGEQPIPNLLSVRYDKPAEIVFVHTDRTWPVCQRLLPVIAGRVRCLKTDAYNIAGISGALSDLVSERGWTAPQIHFNLTGGTKPMAFAAYGLARQLGCGFSYLQSEGGKSLLYRYGFTGRDAQMIAKEEVPCVINLDDYLRVHLAEYTEEMPDNPLEKIIFEVLEPPVLNEVKTCVRHGGALEIDLVMRCGNQVGIAEIKGGRGALGKGGIDQLNTAAEQRYLGTYTRKFLIVDRPIEANNRALAEAHRIAVIELCSACTGSLSEDDRRSLVDTITKALGGRP
jgi:hypothetical protein